MKTIKQFYEANKDKYNNIRDVYRDIENGVLETKKEKQLVERNVKVVIEN